MSVWKWGSGRVGEWVGGSRLRWCLASGRHPRPYPLVDIRRDILGPLLEYIPNGGRRADGNRTVLARVWSPESGVRSPERACTPGFWGTPSLSSVCVGGGTGARGPGRGEWELRGLGSSESEEALAEELDSEARASARDHDALGGR